MNRRFDTALFNSKQSGAVSKQTGSTIVPRPCGICASPHRTLIEAEFVAGRSPRAIAATFGLNFQAVYRHGKNHLPASLHAAAAAHLASVDTMPSGEPMSFPSDTQVSTIGNACETSLSGSLCESPPLPLSPIATGCNTASPLEPFTLACELRNSAASILERAEQRGDAAIALNAIRTVIPVLDRLERLMPRNAQTGSSVPFTQSSEWVRVRSALISALAPYPEARLAVAETLASVGALS